MGRVTRSGYAVALVSAPASAVALGWIAVLALASTGEHPIWSHTPRNLPEAAAFRDGAAIVRMARQGEDVNASGEVREGYISREPVTVTPLEAAVEARRGEIVRLLFELGAAPHAATWTTLWCKAEDAEIRMLLGGHRPEGAKADCPD
jgi:hypothetical protein